MQFPFNRTQGGWKVRDDHVDLVGQFSDSGTDLLVFRHMGVGVPTQRKPKIFYHHAVIEMVRVAPEIRAPLGAVETQTTNLRRVIVEIIKPRVGICIVAPEGIHFLLWCIEVLVVARHVHDRRDIELAADERQAVIPVAVQDIAGQDEQVPGRIRCKLALGIRQVPFP